VVGVVGCALFSTHSAFAGPTDIPGLAREKGAALVTLKFVLKVSGPMVDGEEESETEVTGVMIDPKGVVLCSNTQLAGFVGMIKKMMGPMGSQINATPTDLKVLVGDDTEGKEAELIARDTELDIAWVKIKEPGDKPYDHIDLAKSAKLEVGQPIAIVRRMGKFFNRATVVTESRIGGTTSKPRTLYIPSSTMGMTLGLPVFSATGELLGVMVSQTPESDEGDFNPLAMLSMLSDMQDSMTGLILPATDVARATTRALEGMDKK
jgi:hypothetical protein